LSVIDVATNTVVGSIPVAGGPAFLATNAAGSRAYVALIGTTRVSVVDLVTSAVIATTAPVGAGQSYITLSGDEAFLYAPDFSGGAVRVIDTATNTLTTSFLVAPAPN